jgi:hypothetical protein
VFSEAEFERRYRMLRCVYEEVCARLLESHACFLQKNDAVGMSGVPADVKITAALRQLSLGVGAVSSSTAVFQSRRHLSA